MKKKEIRGETFQNAYGSVIAALWMYRVKQITVSAIKQILANQNKHMARPILRRMRSKSVVSHPRTDHGENVYIVNLNGLDSVLGQPPDIIENNEQS